MATIMYAGETKSITVRVKDITIAEISKIDGSVYWQTSRKTPVVDTFERLPAALTQDGSDVTFSYTLAGTKTSKDDSGSLDIEFKITLTSGIVRKGSTTLAIVKRSMIT